MTGWGFDFKVALQLRDFFYCVIVGIHASISAHVVNEYLLDERLGRWGRNFQEFQLRLGHEGVKDRVENLYFAYLFVLRAVVKAGDYLKHVEFNTGFSKEDRRTLDLMRQLVRFRLYQAWHGTMSHAY